MMSTYEDYLERIQTDAMRNGLTEFRLAREEFHNLTGKFEDGEPWFELRMTMFLDWYLLDRVGQDQFTPAERFLTQQGNELTPKDRVQMEYLTVTWRSIFQIIDIKDDTLRLNDLAKGGHWLVHSMIPTIGFNKDDILGSRIVFFDGRPTIGRSTVLHQQDANETILKIVERARTESLAPRALVDHLDKMRLKLDRYSNVRIQHVYRYPGDAIF
jgi:hypothetical protein